MGVLRAFRPFLAVSETAGYGRVRGRAFEPIPSLCTTCREPLLAAEGAAIRSKTMTRMSMCTRPCTGFPFGLDYPTESNSATVLGVWHQFSIESGTPRPPGAKTARLGSLMDLPAKTGPSGSPMRIGRGSKFRWPCELRFVQFLIPPQFRGILGIGLGRA